MNLFLVLCSILPNSVKILIYRRILGWEIGYDVKIGFSYIDAKNVFLEDRVRIGHFNVIRNIRHLRIGTDTYMANFNSIFGSTYDGWPAYLKIGKSVKFMSHHFLDIGGKVTISDNAIIAGRGSHLWSHTIAYSDSGNPALQPLNIFIGNNAYIGANSVLVGCSIPDNAIVGAGSLVNKQFEPESSPILIAGNPAIIKKRYVIASPDS